MKTTDDQHARDTASGGETQTRAGEPSWDQRRLQLEATIATLLDQLRDTMTAVTAATSATAPRARTDHGSMSLGDLARAAAASPGDQRLHTALGLRLLDLGRHAEAATVLRVAVSLDPAVPNPHFQLGRALTQTGEIDAAMSSFRAALDLEAGHVAARKALAHLLVSAERFDEALELWQSEIRAAPHDAAPLRECVGIALRAHRIGLASEYAARHARHLRASPYWPERGAGAPPFARTYASLLSASKLRHDIEQLEYLRDHGIVGDEVGPILDGYARALARIAPAGESARLPLGEAERTAIGDVYNRIVHVAAAPRVEKALSYAWDMAAVEEEYLTRPPGIVAVDGLLSEEALASLYRFCLESTVWSGSRYGNGYLGAYFMNGFNPPLVLQIAEELRAAMPRVIGDRSLLNLWAFKYDQQMKGTNIHADAASVNVNFWLTPDEANLDQDSGGLVVYDVEAPASWDFATYNGPTPQVMSFLEESKARAVSFAYKRNRAVIFNSDLFHYTAPFHFKPGYANRRINVTMLFGTRNDAWNRVIAYGQLPPELD